MTERKSLVPPGLHEIRAQTVEGPLLVQLRHRRGAAVLDGLGQRAARERP